MIDRRRKRVGASSWRWILLAATLGEALRWVRPVDPHSQHPHRDHDVTVPAAPDDPDRPRRLAWAEILKRAFRLDVLVCPSCGGPMGLVAVILDPAVAAKIVRHRWPRPLRPAAYAIKAAIPAASPAEAETAAATERDWQRQRVLQPQPQRRPQPRPQP